MRKLPTPKVERALLFKASEKLISGIQFKQNICVAYSELLNYFDVMIKHFSDQLFCDVDIQELSIEEHATFIIGRVAQKGTLNDWKLLNRLFKKSQIEKSLTNISFLDKKTLAFFSNFLGVPKENFRCYKRKQSRLLLWDY